LEKEHFPPIFVALKERMQKPGSTVYKFRQASPGEQKAIHTIPVSFLLLFLSGRFSPVIFL
jgi:hypothetical protein